MNQKQLDQIAEIKNLSTNAEGQRPIHRTMAKIWDICEQIELDHKTERRLKNDANRIESQNLVSH